MECSHQYASDEYLHHMINLWNKKNIKRNIAHISEYVQKHVHENLFPITYASSEDFGETAQVRSLTKAIAAHTHKVGIQMKTQTKL